MTELQKRLLVAAVGIPSVLAIIFIGNILFPLAIIIASSIALNEFYNIASKKEIQPDKVTGIIIGAVLQVIIYLVSTGRAHPVVIIVLLFLSILMVLLRQLFSKKRPNPILNIATTLGGVIYISLFFGSLLILREFAKFSAAAGLGHNLSSAWNDNSLAWIVTSILVSVWVCDSAAYFVGKAFGKKKLFPRISPKKTWEGAIAGLVGATLTFMLASYFFFPEIGMIHAVVMGTIIGISGQTGDLAESQLKRDAGVKDSSGLFPGHGGMLDRFDSIIFVAPIMLCYLILIIIL